MAALPPFRLRSSPQPQRTSAGELSAYSFATASIAVMEIIDNAIMLAVPGAMDAGLTSWLFWGALAFSLAVAFVVTMPFNKWMIGRGKGHAVVHAYH